ncbi:MAG: hypothetical protein IT219_06835, partial [Bacteroidales bacterium]|nr:hypothetical protein [Bacteroidales bacterium]
KYEAFGWSVMTFDGNDMNEVLETLHIAKEYTGKGAPVLLLMKTEMGCGVDYMMGTHKWHGSAPNDEQKELALNQLEQTLGDY